jgi:DNA (cytosine-5)-methyltransferase 1
MKYTYLEVCAGCGGLSYGLECAGLEASVLIEMDKTCIKTLKRNFSCKEIIESDMRKIDYKKYYHKIDLLAGGIPCQSYSIAGKREGLDNEDKGGLFYDYLRALDEIDPHMFLIENVEGLLNINSGETIKFMIKELEKREYTVNYKLLNAMYYNVPQKRKRLIIIGTKFNIPFYFPEPLEKILTLKDAFKDIVDSPGMEYSEEKKKILKLVPPGGCWINLPLEIQKKYMGKSFESGGGKRGIARRLDYNSPCLTLTTSPCQKQTERCHPTETRPLKTREYARIQTFPDNFIFEGTTNNIYKQIGNAVPCMLGYYIGIQIRKCLDDIYIRKLKNIIFQNYLLNTTNKMQMLEELIKKFYMTKTINIYESKVDRKRTKIDEIKKESDKIAYNFTDEEWEKFDTERLKDKQINNKIGELHEYLLRNANDFCKSNDIEPELKLDIMKKDKTILLEIKNKHNTMNSSSKNDTINKLKKAKEKYPNAICAIGIVNGSNHIKKICEKPEIYEYSGEKLFDLVFNDKNYYNNVLDCIKKCMPQWMQEYRTKSPVDDKLIESIESLKISNTDDEDDEINDKSTSVYNIINTLIYNLSNHINFENTKNIIIEFADLIKNDELLDFIIDYNYPKLNIKYNEYIKADTKINKPTKKDSTKDGKIENIVYKLSILINILNDSDNLDDKLKEYEINILEFEKNNNILKN